MTAREALWHRSLSRRKALAGLAGFLAGSNGVGAQQDKFRDHSRIPGLSEMRDVFDFEAAAYERLDRATYNYTARGGGSEFTTRRNREAFDWVSIVPRAAGDPGPPGTAGNVLGTPMAFPIMLAPTAAHEVLHPDKEAATYAGCMGASETPMIVSHVASMPFADIAKADGGPLWFQLYPREELEQNREPLESAQAAGAGAIVVTIDQQASFYDRGYHDRNLSLRPRRPPRYSGNAARYRFTSGRMWYEWKLFDGLRGMVRVPMLAKGILTAEDALLAVEHGLDGIIISNHGGRTLDYTPSSLEVLPEIVEAVAGRIPVLIDSGFRRGSDILKAMALGASAICLGRVPRWGLGSFGAPGVTRVLEIVQEDFRQAMTSCGAASLGAIDRSLVRTDFP
ncbi:MAG: alpha-hydroxy acid oxidase [Bryobacterales bacterium]|nr:alpha-hydroxy acid oxidase [Bryobacterales bacterium]MDE0623709.1 alpha-hydroxy acid oxidase [Bryobacterales bacterium]